MSLRSKLILSTLAIVAITLLLLGGIADELIGREFQRFFDIIQRAGFQRPGSVGLAPEKFLEDVRKALIYTALGAGIFAIVLSTLLANRILKPIQKVIEATQNIAEGKHKQRLSVDSKDELGQLSHSVNEMAEALERNEERRRQLITDLSHELGTPLTSLKGYLEALEDGLISDKQKQHEAYKIMQAETERLQSMLRDLRELSLVHGQGLKLKKKVQPITPLVERVIQQMQPELKHKKLELTHNLAEHTKLKALLDADRFIQILVNLLSNAIKFTPQKGTIKLTLSKSKQSFSLKIEDSGIGIAKSELKKIFERFYQSDHSRNRKTRQGTGVGLSITKELVEAHGGKITVTSKKDEGSCFTCSFPLS